jgi:hypothetical protein
VPSCTGPWLKARGGSELATAGLALYFGLAGSAAAARTFLLAFGAVYALLGVLGFVAPTLVGTILGMPDMTAHELVPYAPAGLAYAKSAARTHSSVIFREPATPSASM